ncbi:MAG: hypothetical protein WC998_03880 [Candidatus Paceibacterota bacterium]
MITIIPVFTGGPVSIQQESSEWSLFRMAWGATTKTFGSLVTVRLPALAHTSTKETSNTMATSTIDTSFIRKFFTSVNQLVYFKGA